MNTKEIKLPPYPEGMCLREDIEDYAREAVRLNAQAVPEISTEHGPWVESPLHEGETYCTRCLVRSVFADRKKCEPHIDASPVAPQPAAPVHPRDDAVFELWWADHMPNASQADAWAEWCSLRANQPEPQSAAQPGELSADALDAKRYRWLRTRWGRIADEYDGDSNQLVAIREADSHFEGLDVDPLSLDRAIDAAMQRTSGSE